MAVRPFSDEQARVLVNLRQRYEVWRDAERDLRAIPYDLRRKRVGEYEYLYEIADRSGNGRSLGAWDDDKAARFESYRARKAELQDRVSTAREGLAEVGRLARALRLPQLPAPAGAILREADLRGLLAGDLLVVGTNCLPAYEVEAAGSLPLSDETEDFDLAWTANERPDGAPFWETLKAVDATFAMNAEREFQARNAKAYEVELLVAPSKASTLARRDKPRPVPLPEQEWLLLGTRVDQVALCRDGSAARIVAPDPRWFALHKLWLGRQAKRDPLKRRKDLEQGRVVLEAVAEAMPQYALDENFVASIPRDLAGDWQRWRSRRA